jgi:hypothetical protein
MLIKSRNLKEASNIKEEDTTLLFNVALLVLIYYVQENLTVFYSLNQKLPKFGT